MIYPQITFNNSIIWPDNSIIKWEIEGIGKLNTGRIKFIIRTNAQGFHEGSCFVSVMEDNDPKWCIEDSPIFWNIDEWTRIYKDDPEYAMKHQYHLARQAAMRWVENYYYTKLV